METVKTAIITGAYGAIGKAIARQIALNGFKTILVGRDEERLKIAAEEISKRTGNYQVFYEIVDLSRKSSIQAFAGAWSGPVHVLVNNAAYSPRRRAETHEGIEIQFATNVLGYFWMITFFSGFMKKVEGARIINVASYWAGGLDINDLEFKKRPYDNDASYRQSKQADRMLTIAFADKLKPLGITVNSCHPGDVNSKLSNDLGFGGHETPGEGADTPLWLATDPSLTNITGKYFENRRETNCPFAKDMEAVDKLYDICDKY
jgi:NAD(P)-dependent dehydrogenase (short-subunit alcohol dehydrogenase family)